MATRRLPGRFVGRVKCIIGAVVIAGLVVFLFNSFGIIRRFDELLYAFRFPTGDSVSPDILLVEITQRTLKSLGNVPIPRNAHATVLEKLGRHRGNVIGITPWFNRASSEPHDSQLAHIASLNKNIIFVRPAWTNDSSGRVFYSKLDDVKPTSAVELYLEDLSGSLVGLTAIYTHLSSPASRWLEVLPVKMVRVFRESQTSDDPRVFDTNPFDFIHRYKLKFSSADPISLEPFIVKMPINYVGNADAFQRIPYERLLGDEDFSWIRDKIIIIGAALPGQGILTPLSFKTGMLTSYPVVIANAVNTILTGRQIRTLHPIITFGLIWLYCIILLLSFQRIRSNVRRSLIGMGVFLGLLGMSHFLFAAFRFQMVVFPYFLVWFFIYSYFAIEEFLKSRVVVPVEIQKTEHR